MVCQVCFDLRPDKVPDKAKIDGKRVRIECGPLLKSKAQGCQVCYAVFRGLEIFTQEVRGDRPMKDFLRSVGPDRFYVNMILRSDTRPLQLEAFVRLPRSLAVGEPRRSLVICFEVFTDQKPTSRIPIRGIGPARKVAAKPSSDRRLRLIKEWTTYCRDNHEACREWQAQSDGVGPRRVLDLSGNPRSRIKLLDPFDRVIHGDYATFSHPWADRDAIRVDGKDNAGSVVRLTTGNYAAMKRGIRWADLPAAFKDAVVVAAEQGFLYLWIEALCVIQNDDTDFYWHVEHMGDIHRGSTLSVSPTRLSGIGASFLGPRTLLPALCATSSPAYEPGGGAGDQEPMKAHEVVLSRGKRKFSVYVRRRLCASHIGFDNGHCGHTLTKYHRTPYWVERQGPMLTSAWAFTQRMVSTRTVHFHASEMVWECRSGTTCECRVSWSPAVLDPSRTNSRWLVPSKSRYLVVSRKAVWSGLMSLYPRLHMGDNSHRFHALAGAIAVDPWASQQGCYAGIFANTREELAKGLLWSVRRESQDPARRTCRYDCGSFLPSWSWVSLAVNESHAVVDFDRSINPVSMKFRTDPRFQVGPIDHRSLAGSTEYGGLSGSSWSLTLHGRMMLGKISPKFRWHRGQPFVPSSEPLLDFFIPSPKPWLPPWPNAFSRPPPPPPPPSSPPLPPPAPPIPPYATVIPVPNSAGPPQSPMQLDSFRWWSHASQGQYTPSELNPLFKGSAVFRWDCDQWADQVRSCKGPIYAYFLLLGVTYSPESIFYVSPSGDDGVDYEETDKLPYPHHIREIWDVGLVLQRAAPRSAGSHPRGDIDKIDGALERVGVFSVPRQRNFFASAEVQGAIII